MSRTAVWWAALVLLCACNDDPTDTVGDACDDCTDVEVGDDTGFDITARDIEPSDAPADVSADTDDEGLDTAEPDARPDTAVDVEAEVDDGPTDSDGDGVIDDLDAFPDDVDEWEDADGDGVGDNADACDDDPEDSVDTDGDGVCDASDACPDDEDETSDSDGDGVCDLADAFPDDPGEHADTDDDGIGDEADDDDDDDGVVDAEELDFGGDCMISDPLLADTDDDGVPDADDPYPRDPFVEFMLRANDRGSIDLFLSNRDGTFRDPVEIGEPIEFDGTTLTYTAFSIGDFDRDGRMDFTAHSSRLHPEVELDRRRNFYFFFRDDKEDEFRQAFIGETDRVIAGAMVDADDDDNLDIATFTLDRPDYIATGTISVFLNNYDRRVSCVYAVDPTLPCFFYLASEVDLTAVVSREWVARMARQSVNLNPATDDFRDLTILTYASGGNAATDVYTLFGNGDGTFDPPTMSFTHNGDRSRAPGNSFLFADFDGDAVGDILVGFDDDGEPGNAWTYLGDGAGGFSTTPIDAVDLNPTDARETGGRTERLGRSGSGRTFDFDFDGAMDLIIGYDHINYAAGSNGQTRLYAGNGDGTFGPAFSVIGPESTARHNFAIPTRLCPEFAFESDTELPEPEPEP